MSWKIIADSGCNFRTLPQLAAGAEFVSVPLTITVGDEVFVDDAGLNIDQMMTKMYATTTASLSACPSPEAYRQALEGSEQAIIVTITGGLSGSYNSARLGAEMYLETNPDAQVFVLDTLSAGGEQDLIVLEINRLVGQGLSFDEVVAGIKTYCDRTKLIFILAKVDNLVKNGRLSKLVGTVVGLLNIRMVGRASTEGKLELLHKARGQKKAVTAAIDEMLKAGYQGGRVLISHRQNDKICEQLSEAIKAHFPQADIQLVATSGLCSFYAEEGGILMGYEV